MVESSTVQVNRGSASRPVATALEGTTMSDKVYSVQARRYGSWLVCSGREPRKSYRVVAFTGDYERAKVMAALRCVCPTTIAACEAAAAKAVIPDEPVEA